jgi:TolC family type I secretion outer membrane protein
MFSQIFSRNSIQGGGGICAARLLAATALALLCGPAFAAPGTPAPHRLTVGETLRYVYENNPSIKAAAADLDATKELYPQARAGYRPTLSAEASVYAAHIDNSNFPEGDGATTKQWAVNLDQPLYRGGRTSAETARAKNLIRAGNALRDQNDQNVFLAAATAYFDVVRDRDLSALSRGNAARLRQELDGARARFTAGEITKTDVRQAESRLARAEAEQVISTGNYQASRAAFESVVGFLPPETIDSGPAPFVFPQSLDSMIATAEDANPGVIKARYDHKAARNEIDAASSDHLPQLSAFASYDKQLDPQPGIVDDTAQATIGLRARLALYQGGLVNSRVRQAESNANRRGYQLSEAERDVREQVTKNWRALESARAETASRRAEISAARTAREGVGEEARLGERSVLDVLDADQELQNAEAALVRAARNEAVAAYALAASLGMLRPEKMGMDAAPGE